MDLLIMLAVGWLAIFFLVVVLSLWFVWLDRRAMRKLDRDDEKGEVVEHRPDL
jgi:membrane protein implicated in regulation of membrane protease activity